MSSPKSSHLALISSGCCGSLLGALIGDCHGSPFEFAGRPRPKKVLDFVLKFRGNKLEEPDSETAPPPTHLPFSDDTAMTRSVAGSLIAHRGYDAVDMAKRFGSEFEKEPERGYGYNVTTVFDAINTGNYDGDIYRPAAAQFGGSGSYGNGGAMRIAPVALFQFVEASKTSSSSGDSPAERCPSVESLLRVSTDDICLNSTRLTHSNAFGIHGALLQCLAVKLALRAGLLKDGEDIDVGAFATALIDAMREVEGREASEPKCKKSKLENDHHSEEEIEEDSEEDIDFYDGDDPSNLPYAYVEKLERVQKFLSDHEKTINSNKPSRDDAFDPLRLKPVVTRLGNSVAAMGSVPTAIYCFLRSVMEENMKDGRLKIDTLAASGVNSLFKRAESCFILFKI